MKRIVLTLLTLVFSITLKAQTSQQEYLFKEWNDYFKGVYQLPQNDYKARGIYQQLVQYSGMQFYIRYTQTFQWGQAHYGGIILLDYSALAKPKEILAFIMAHEWGHEALGHQANLYNPYGNVWQFAKGQTDDEDAADVYAGEFLATKGYDISVVTSFLKNLPSTSQWDTHSSGAKRASNVMEGCNSVKGSDDSDDDRTSPSTIYVDCSKCDGAGEIESTKSCSYCGGTGVRVCNVCRGNGGFYSYGYNVYGQYGYWWYVCSGCGGAKRIYCDNCGGTGTVTSTKICYYCNGTGKQKKY